MFGFLYFLDLVRGSVVVAIVNICLSPILNLRCFCYIGIHWFYNVFDLYIFWICSWVGGHSHRKLLSSSSSEFALLFLSVKGFAHFGISTFSGFVMWLGGHSHR